MKIQGLIGREQRHGSLPSAARVQPLADGEIRAVCWGQYGQFLLDLVALSTIFAQDAGLVKYCVGS